MNQRKAIFFSFFILLIVAASYTRGAFLPADGLPNPKLIDGKGLANVPPVEDAIRFVQGKINQNPDDAVSYTLLGDLYMRQARETGNLGGYQLAEESFQEALRLIPNYSPAASSLASVYYSQHEFEKALALAEQVYTTNYKNSQAHILMADSHLSLGHYEQAEKIYNELAETNVTPPLLARIAYLEELKGNPSRGLELIRRAAGVALNSGGTKENFAWYLLRVGDMYFNAGNIKESGEFYKASLRVFENYPPALTGLGKVRAAQGKYDDAIEYYQQAVNIIPQPEFVAALGDLYLVTGQREQAEIQYATVETIGALAAFDGWVYNRQLANFYSDHDRNVEEALTLALTELETRRDIYGYDTAAWAYYKNEKYEEAQAVIELAMSLSTQDARLYYHAGMIAHALHQDELAQQYLEQALAINPHFSILHSPEARETLKAIQVAANK